MAIGNVAFSAEVEACIRACRECHQVCLTAINHCLVKGGQHAAPEHIKVLMDCAASCATSVEFMVRQSDFDEAVCRLCADICTRCADDCERMADDPVMKQCADVCRRCAESCRRMSGPMPAAA